MGKSSNQVAGYRFKLRNHAGLTYGPLDAYLEFRGGDKVAWRGRQTVSGTIGVYAPKLWGGDKDQGGIVGNLHVMMGEEGQTPNPMLVTAFGSQTTAWRGFATVAFDGLYGSNNPYPQAQSHKVEKILMGWDNDTPWYPETAVIPLPDSGTSVVDGSFVVPAGATVGNSGTVYGAPLGADFVGTAHEIAQMCIDARNTAEGTSYTLDESYVYWNGVHGWWDVGAYSTQLGKTVGIAAVHVIPTCPVGATASFVQHGVDSPLGVTEPTVSCAAASGSNAINPAHALYYLRTTSHKGGEPTANIDDPSFRAAADQLYAEGFGICVRIDPGKESPEDVENRICKLIGGAVNRSLEDGKLHLDLARGKYVFEDLPIVSDDDILSFSEQPTSPEGAVNSVSVRYFDPQRKEDIITPSVDALGLIDEFGLNHEVIEYPEIPTAALASRIATREAMNAITPTRIFDLVCKPTVYALRPSQYFRLQLPKRGITDMVCIVGDRQGGTLKSGAIRLQAVQDIFTLPDFGSVDVETGVDPTPPSTPVAITDQVAFEAPYLNVCAAMPASSLAALPVDAGYLVAAAQDPATSRDFTLEVDVGAGYEEQADGDWCPTAIINEAAAVVAPLPTNFTLSGGKLLDSVAVGDVALWGNELCRVDALDVAAGTLSLGRACGDTVPQVHAAGETVWFYGVGAAFDSTEYSGGETVSAKLLTNTWSEQLDAASATALSVTFNQRQSRPYAPGQFKIDGSYYPAVNAGGASMAVTWAHRDRVGQADQLVDTLAATIGPEATVRYGLRCLNAATSALLIEKLDLAGPSAAVILNFTGNVKVQLYAISDNGESWQRHEHTLAYTPPAGTSASSITGATYTPAVWVIDGNGG